VETSYLQAEEIRLLYVAATRAKNLLVISSLGQGNNGYKNNPWKPLLREIQPEMVLEIPEKLKTEKKSQSKIYRVEEFEKQKEMTDRWYKQAIAKNFLEKTPSDLEKFDENQSRLIPTIDKGGIHWGNAVHGVLQYLLSKQPSEEMLFLYIKYSLEKNNISTHRKDELYQLVKKFRDSQLFSRIEKSQKRLTEVPFNLKIISTDPLYQKLLSEEEEKEKESKPIIMNGTIDLVFRELEGWVIVDYKTDCPKYEKDYQYLKKKYQQQIDVYSAIWQKISGEKVKEKIIYFIAR